MLADGASLDAFLVTLDLHGRVYEETGGVDLVGVELAQVEYFFDFGNYVIGRGGHHGIKVAGGFAIDEIAPAGAFPGFDEGEVAAEGALEDILAAVEITGFFAFGDHGANTRGRVKGGNARLCFAGDVASSALRLHRDLQFRS